MTFDGRIAAIDLVAGTVVAGFTSAFRPTWPAVSPGAQRLYVLEDTAGGVRQLLALNTETGEREVTVELPGITSPGPLAIASDESVVFMITQAGLVRLTRATGVIDTVAMSNLQDLALHPDGSRVFVLGSGGAVAALDTTSLAVLDTLTLDSQFGGVSSMSIAPDGARLYFGLTGNTLFSGSTVTATPSPLAQGNTLTGGGLVRVDPTGARLIAIGNSTGTSNFQLLRLVPADGSAVTHLESFNGDQMRLRDIRVGPDFGCAIGAITPTSAQVAHGGGSGSVQVPAGYGCAWTATSSAPWVTIDSGSGGAGAASVRYTAAANGTIQSRQATLSIAGQAFTLTQLANGVIPLPASLRFAARRHVDGSPYATTTSQLVTVWFSGPSAAWTATSDQPWAQVSGGAGSGAGQFTVSIDEPSMRVLTGTQTATVTVSAPSISASATVTVTLTIDPNLGFGAAPFGVVDTPVQDALGVQGAVSMSGWVLDDLGVRLVKIYRSCLSFEAAQPYCIVLSGLPNLGPVVELGDATFVPGARPDVEAIYPGYPAANRAGWGFMILTNMLPNGPAGLTSGGVGTIALHALAFTEPFAPVTPIGRSILDRDPTRITLANDTIAKPFGAIDTPGQGATVSGIVNNFGWVLTPDPGTGVVVPTGGSTISVFLDGAPVGTATYNLCRGRVAVNGVVPSGQLCNDDVSTAFRGSGTLFRNLDAGRGPIGLRAIDTTSLSNGQHTLSWSVTDSANRAEGIGSRYINVVNGATDPYGARHDVDRREHDVARRALTRRETGGPEEQAALRTPLYARTGFDLQTAYAPLAVNADGVPQVWIPELGRVELQVPGVESGALLVTGEVRALPIGVGIDSERGLVSWVPGPGFLGSYRFLLLVQGSRGPGVQGSIVVDVSVVPAQYADEPVRMHVDRVSVEGPALSERTVRVEGWALDPGASSGSGVGAVHVWARKKTSGAFFASADSQKKAPDVFFLGTATLGLSRPDVAAAHGWEYGDAGFAFTGVLPDAGEWEVTAYVWLHRTGRFEDARSVTLVAR